MAEDDVHIVLSSDSDDAPLSDTKFYQAPLSQQLEQSALSEDPDWVRSFAPATASTLKESDSDSIVNLLSEPDDVGDTTQTQTEGETENADAPKPKKRGRPAARPARSSLPLVAAARLNDGLTLLQEGSSSLDLSGDVGAVGRVKVDGDNVMMDIKGTLYSAIPYACNTLCVVTVGDEDAKISAVMNHAVVLRAEKNVFAADYAGALDGHTYESENILVVDGNAVADAEEPSEPKKKRGRPPKDQSKKSISKPRTKAKTASKSKDKPKGRKKV